MYTYHTYLPQIITCFMHVKSNLGGISTERQIWRAEGGKQPFLDWGDEDFQTHLSHRISPVRFTTIQYQPRRICCGWECMKQMLGHALAPGRCFAPTSCLNTVWNRCKYQSCLSCFLQLICTTLLAVNWCAYVIFFDLLIPSTLDDQYSLTPIWSQGGTKRCWCLSGYGLLRYVDKNAAAFGWQLSSTTQQEGCC